MALQISNTARRLEAKTTETGVSSVVVCGGGVVGLCTAMMLARDGLDVTMFEADPAEPPVPVEAWTSWTRKGVAQFRQPHNLFGRFRQICDDELPGLTDKLLAAGCVWVNYLESLPPGIGDRAPRPGDDRLRFVTVRRPVVESVLADAAGEEPGVTVRRGTRVAGLVHEDEEGRFRAALLILQCAAPRPVSAVPLLLGAVGRAHEPFGGFKRSFTLRLGRTSR